MMGAMARPVGRPRPGGFGAGVGSLGAAPASPSRAALLPSLGQHTGMATALAAVTTLHVLFAGLWAGAVALVAWKVVPLIAAGDMDVAAATELLSGLRLLTRASALVFLVTGGHMAATKYGDGRLLGTTDGLVVVGMLVTWLVLTGLVEMGVGRTLSELDTGRLRTAGQENLTLFRVMGGLAVLLLLFGGYLAA